MVSKERTITLLSGLAGFEEKVINQWGEDFKGSLETAELPEDIRNRLIELMDTMVKESGIHKKTLEELVKRVEESDKDEY